MALRRPGGSGKILIIPVDGNGSSTPNGSGGSTPPPEEPTPPPPPPPIPPEEQQEIVELTLQFTEEEVIRNLDLPDIGTQLNNVLFSFPNCKQGWKAFCLITWTGPAVLTQFTYTFQDLTPMNPLLSQSNTL